MDERERRMRHKRYLARKRKQQQKRKRMIIGVISLAVILGVVAGGSIWLSSVGGVSENNQVAAKLSKPVPITNIDQEQMKALVEKKITGVNNAAKTATVGDRSAFAVKPGETVGKAKASKEKTVYLTLDDGPSVNTQKVLDILEKYNCKATFFVTNINPEYKDMIKKCYDAGHTIGLHTYSHDYAKVYASKKAYFEDLDKIGAVVKKQIGYVPAFIRFPGGSSNGISKEYTKGIMTELTKDVIEKGYQYYDWNNSSGDGGNCSTKKLIKNATSVDYTNIVLLSHDSNGKENTVKALPKIIEYYQAKGYVFKAIDKESVVPHHKVSN